MKLLQFENEAICGQYENDAFYTWEYEQNERKKF